ncbi:beta-hexosaminidase-like [Haliotis cracherodii]|uniref:beta-hexosaminidase-like n=1 Tax=Haliotis cracherodii TaxID=6455 RepID=UPI0039EC198E
MKDYFHPIICLFALNYLSTPLNGLRQETVNYIARYMDVRYDVIDNLRDALKTFEAQITMTNTGSKTIPGKGWSIYFCHLNLLEPEFLPSVEGAVLENYGIRFRHTQGCLFMLELLDNFQDIPPGATRSVKFLSENFSVSKSDGLPNWYVASEGLESRVILSTAGESFDFVGDFDTPNKWKRYDFITEEAEGHDRYDPFTPRVRYSMNQDTKDLGSANNHLIPTPAKMSVNGKDKISLQTKDWRIFADGNFSYEAQYLAERLGINVIATEPSSGYIKLTKGKVEINIPGRQRNSPEAYSLSVDPDNGLIEIRASAPAGVFYGVQTLLKLMDDDLNVPHVTVVDAPRYAYRGVMLDVARNFHSKEQVLRLMNIMAMYKLNKLHLHLTDDEGWRLEIPGLEELTQVAGRRCHDPKEEHCILPFLGSGPTSNAPGTGFYTTKDYQEIVRYARDHHIEVIPEVDMPGHGHAVIKAMEARRKRFLAQNNVTAANEYVLVEANDPSVYKSIQMYTDNAVNPCLPSTYRFIYKIVKTLHDLHKDISPLKIFHFGGDEVAKGAWENSTACEQVFGNGFDIADTKILKQLFLRQVANLTSQFGLDLAAWEDGMMESGSTPYQRGGLQNKNIYGYAWDNIWEWGAAARAYKLANAGYKVVMAQATHLYFDHPYEPDPLERGLYWAPRYTDTRKTFGFMPMNMYANADVARSGDPLTKKDVCGEDLDGCIPLEKPENIVGMQGHLWSELVRNRDIADYMMFPRLLALAERAWHEAAWEEEEDNRTRQAMEDRDWERFANTLGYSELKRLENIGIKYRVPPPGAIVEGDILRTNVAYPGLTVEYSLNEGESWCQASEPVLLRLAKSTRILLRTRGANGSRVSRVVHLFTGATVNSGNTLYPMFPLVLSIICVMFM